MGESYIARMQRRAIVTILVGATIYAAGVAAGPLLGTWVHPAPWYPALLGLENACDRTLVPADCRPDGNDVLDKTVTSIYEKIKDARDPVPYWFHTKHRIVDECSRSLRRQCQLTDALDANADPSFKDARRLLDEERARFARLADQEHHLKVERYEIGVRIAFGLVDIVIALLATSFLVRAGRSNLSRDITGPDPTIPFIGENWWKLPATLGTILLALWQVLEWTGAAQAIADAAGR
jgi:hypothetical protein